MASLYKNCTFVLLLLSLACHANAADKNSTSSPMLSVPASGMKLNTRIRPKSAPLTTAPKAAVTTKPATGITPPVTVKVKPGGGLSNKQLGKFNELGRNSEAARNAKNMQGLENARQGRIGQTLNRGSRRNDPASGTALGGRTFDRSNSPGSRNQQGGFNAQDCIASGSNCFSSRGNNRRGGMQAAPSARPGGLSKGNNQGWASGDSTSGSNGATSGHERYTGVGTRHEERQTDHGNTETSDTTDNSDGTSTSHAVLTDSDGNKLRTTDRYVDADGNHTYVIYNHENGETSKITTDSTGRVTGASVRGANGEDLPVPKRYSPGSQPREDGRSGGNGGGCNWNPVWGRCMGPGGMSESERLANKKKGIGINSQPGQNQEDGSSSSGSAVNIQLRKDVVTNTEGVQPRSSSTGGGKSNDCVLVQGGRCGGAPNDPTAGPGTPAAGVR